MNADKKPTVLHINYGLKTGGAERVSVNYAKFLDKRKYNVSICALTSNNHYGEELAEAGVECYLLGKRGRLDFSLLFRLYQLMRRLKVDIVHFHDVPTSVWSTIPARLAGVPVIMRTLHNTTAPEANHSRFFIGVLRRMYARHTHFIAVSAGVHASQTEKYPRIADRITIQHNGIDPTPYEQPVDRDACLAELGLEGREFVIGVVARLARQKAHEVFLKAMKRIGESNDNVAAVIVGDGPRRAELTDLADRLSLGDRVVFVGVRNDVPRLLRAIDVMCLSSNWEGLPITILEAMASARPVVVTDVGGNREAVIDGETGIIVPPENPDALADALLRLAGDPESRAEMGRNARARFEEEFAIDAMIRTTESIYDDCLGKRKT